MLTKPLPSTVSFTSARFQTQGLSLPPDESTLLFDRFLRIPGANQQALADARIDLIGCGGLGGEVGHGLVRKGIGQLTLYDHDHVDVTNLARQHFSAEDVGKAKALALAKNLADQATGRSLIRGHACAFQEAAAKGINLDGQIAVVGVDNNRSRIDASRYYLERGVPVLFLAVNDRASAGYVFLQTSQPGDPCFQCLFPDAGEDRRTYGCAGASIEILKIVAGITLYAIDSLLMARPRPWNYKAVYLDQSGDGQQMIAQRTVCPLCGGTSAHLPSSGSETQGA